MAGEQIINFIADTSYSTGTKKYLRKLEEFTKMVEDPEMRILINYFILEAINPYVPKKSGELKRSYKVYPDRITWGEGLEYARYQFGGVVYEPNYKIWRDGKIVGWWSLPGVKKQPTNRKLGVPGEWKGWKFGYKTPNTRSHWTDVYQWNIKKKTNLKITDFLKKECKMRGLNV